MNGRAVEFREDWRRKKSAAFDLHANSTAGRAIEIDLWGTRRSVYANANLSIYSAQSCNASCPFCVEELRPASRGVALAEQKRVEGDDDCYFERLEETLVALKPLELSASVTGGEPSLDPRLPRILQLVAQHAPRKRTMTTNGSGLLRVNGDRRVIDWIAETRLHHLNISIAHPDSEKSGRIMRLPTPLSTRELREIVSIAKANGIRVRLSCLLLKSGVATLDDMLDYLRFAQASGVDNVIFRQAMKVDLQTHARNSVVLYSDRQRVLLEPLLEKVSRSSGFRFVRQIVGYYYYVEIWQYQGIDVVFEEADLAQLETVKRHDPNTIYELVFHPVATLNSTWQPWDGELGPPLSAIRTRCN